MIGTFAGSFLLLLSASSSPAKIAIRAFKQEHVMEIWGSGNERGRYRLLATYPIAAMSGTLGPKTREGDLQVPEGFYTIDRFNPHSRYHLSLGLNYPNAHDRRVATQRKLGNNIFIHGNHVSAGCMAMTDPVIDVIYRLADHAHQAGDRNIPVAIFPCRLTQANWKLLSLKYFQQPKLLEFWSTLMPGYKSFERDQVWRSPSLDRLGNYVWR